LAAQVRMKAQEQGQQVPYIDSVLRNVKRWERGDYQPRDFYLGLLAALYEVHPADVMRFDPRTPTQDRVATAETERLIQSTLGSRIDPAQIADIEQASDRLARLYAVSPPSDLLPRVQQRIQTVNELMKVGGRLDDRGRLSASGAWLFLLLASLHGDLGHRETALACREVAYRLGIDLDHSAVIGWSFEIASWLGLVDGLYVDALQAAEAGVVNSPARSSALAQNALKVAQANALLRRPREAQQALDLAEETCAVLPPAEHPEHHFVFDPGKFDTFASQTYTELRMPDRAGYHARRVIESARDHPRRVSMAQVDLANSRFDLGELDEACAVGEQALGGSFLRQHMLVRAGQLARRMQDRYPRAPEVRGYVEHYHDARRAFQQG
jgi:hypothetical protein